MSEVTYIPHDAVEVVGVETENNNITTANREEEALRDQIDMGEGVSTIYVKKHLSGNNSPCADVTSFPADKYTYSQLVYFLQTEYGGGDYRIMVYGKKPNGKKTVLLENKLVSIAHKIDKSSTAEKQPPSDMGIILEAIREQNNAMMNFITSKDNQQNSRREMLEEMMMYKNLFSNNTQQENPMKAFTEMAGFLQTFGVEINNKKDDDDSMVSLVREFAPAITEAVRRPVSEPPKNPAEDKRKKQMNRVVNGLKMLLNAAKVNADQGMYAEMIVQQFGEKEIKIFVLGEKAMETAKKMCPEISQYMEWFKLLIEHVKAQYNIPSSVSHLYDDVNDDIKTENSGEVIDGDIIDGELQADSDT